MRNQFVIRVKIIVGIVIFVALVILGRLYVLQVMHGEHYRELASSQYVQSSSGVFDRGSIYFTEKDGNKIAAASLVSGYLLAILPDRIADPEAVYDTLSKHIELDKEAFLARASKKDDPYEEVLNHIDPSVAEKIREEDIEGVQLFREQWRFYPGGSIGSHILGYVGFGGDGRFLKGQYGLERYWESVLTRRNEKMHVNFFAEVFTNARDFLHTDIHKREGDLVTSVDT